LNNKGDIFITNTSNNSTNLLPVVKFDVTSEYINRGLVDLRTRLGLDLPGLNNLNLYLETTPITNRLLKVTSLTKVSHIDNRNYDLRINFPYKDFIFYPINATCNTIVISLNNVLKSIVACLDVNLTSKDTGANWFNSELNDIDKLLLQKTFKTEMMNSILNERFTVQSMMDNNPFYKSYTLGNFIGFKSYIDNSLFILAGTKRPLFEGLT
jgi:hypothetical protein